MIKKYMLPILWLLAFVSGLFLIPQNHLEFFGIAVILAFIWGWCSLCTLTDYSLPQSGVMYTMIAFWLLSLLSVITSDILSVSVMAFGLLSMLPLTFLVFTLQNNKTAVMITAKLAGFVLAILGLWAIIQVTFLAEQYNGRAGHPLANPNSLAALFSFGFFGFSGAIFLAKTKRDKIISTICALILFAGIMACASRGAFFAALPALGILLFVMRHQVKGHYLYVSALILGCIILFALTTFGFNDNANLAHRIFDSSADNANQFTNNRIKLWQAAWEMIKAYGLWGTGIGTYFLYFPEFRLSDDISGGYYAHNDALQYWAELGILGFILFYGFCIAVLWRTVKAIKAAPNTEAKALILTPFCALLACLIHTHVTFNLYNLSINFIAGLALAIWFIQTQSILKTPILCLKLPKSFTSLSRQIALAIPFALIGFLFSGFILGEHYNNRAKDHLFAGELEEFASDVILAQKIGFGGNHRPYLLATNIPLSILEEEKANLDLQQRVALTEHAYGYIHHVMTINPRSSSALYYMAKLLQIGEASALPDTIQTADYYYKQALKIDPLHIGARMALATIKEQGEKPDEALAILEAGAHYRYNTPMALSYYSMLARYYLMQNNPQKRDEALEKLSAFQKRLGNLNTKSDTHPHEQNYLFKE